MLYYFKFYLGGLPVVNVNDFLNVKTNKHHIVAIGC